MINIGNKKRSNQPMNFIAICLHSLDMRDFHSNMRDTPFLDELKKKSIFIPIGRGQGHFQNDSLISEMTGLWTARCTNSLLTKEGIFRWNKFILPKTLLEYLVDFGYELITCIGRPNGYNIGTWAVNGAMNEIWLKYNQERMKQFNNPFKMNLEEWLHQINHSKKKFYAHIFLRDTHRPWNNFSKLRSLVEGNCNVPDHEDIFCARKAALEKPDELAQLRREGLQSADRKIRKIFEVTRHISNTTYIIYSNHGEVYDHFRYNLLIRNLGDNLVVGTSHGPFPYEVLYANMQMWLIPERHPKVMQGIARLIDFAPTIMDLARINHPKMDGESMLKYFHLGKFPNRIRFAECNSACSLVREDNYKFISNTLASELQDEAKQGVLSTLGKYHRIAVFDLNTDPWEYHNLINTQKGKEIFKWAFSEYKKIISQRLLELRNEPSKENKSSIQEKRINDNSEEIKSEKELIKQIIQKKGVNEIDAINLNLCGKCNFCCITCPQSYHLGHYKHPEIKNDDFKNIPKGMIDKKTIKNLFASLIKTRTKARVFTIQWNGESMMHKNFAGLYEYMCRENKKRTLFDAFVLNTNASFLSPLMNKRIFYATKKFRQRLILTFSLDSNIQETFSKIKKTNVKVSGIISCIKNFIVKSRNYPGIVCIVQTIVLEENMHEQKDFYEFWSEFFKSNNLKYKVIYSLGQQEDGISHYIYFRTLSPEDIGNKLMKKFEPIRKKINEVIIKDIN